ncbi:87R protein [Yaba-like disease virus]|uniref:87R protein n=1 Tax=Yaba-like disease virus TaxID=132475 RepID=Q9DHM6_YLDV|nr:87R protein [Yaba-like disease virus]CAC21325.1 87R protein [Yaba-like disease virus]
MMEYYSNVLVYIMKNNRKLSKTYTLIDDSQRVFATGFNNQVLQFIKKISICAILLTSDNKYIACSRNSSFLFNEIIRSKNQFRKKRLFLKYPNYLKKTERQFLSSELNIKLSYDIEKDYSNIIFPGGIPKNGENVLTCLSREIKEEINIDNRYIFLDSRFFIHLLIEDLLTNRVYETILFMGKTTLSSKEVSNNFLSNKEIKSLVFFDKSEDGLFCEIVRFALSISKLKCFGNNGTRDSLHKLVKDPIRYVNLFK